MDIIMAFNTGFLLPALTAIYSLFSHNNNVRLRILYVELSETSMIILNKLQKIGTGNTIEYVCVDGKLLERIKVSTGRWRQETFFRYYITEIIPEYDRVLWLDADILVRKNIEDLFNKDFEGRSFAAVYDNSSDPEKRLGIKDYVNAGILLINAEKLKKTKKIDGFWDLVASPDYKGELPDQDALNIVFKDDIKIIDQIWNMFPLVYDKYADQFIQDSAIIHYVSKHKPWNPEDTDYFVSLFDTFRSAEVFINEYWDVCEKAVQFVS